MNVFRKEKYGSLFALMFSFLLLLSGILIGHIFFGSQETEGEGRETVEQNNSAIPVLAQRIGRGTLEGYSRFNATLEPDSSYYIFPQLSGEVAEIYVERGEQVEAGELLFRLRGEEITAQRRQAEASLKQAKAELARLESGAREEELAQSRAVVEQAEASLRGAREVLSTVKKGYEDRFNYRQQVLNAENQVENARVQVEIAELQYRQAESVFADAEDAYSRVEYLYEREAISEREYRSTKSQYEQAEIQKETTSAQIEQARKNLTSAREILELARRTYERPVELEQQLANARMQVETAEANLASARAQHDQVTAGPTSEQLESVRAQVEYTEHALQIASSQEDKLVIKSPASGIVSQLNVEVGELTSGQTQTPPVVVISPDFLVRLHVSEEIIPLLSRGQEVGISIPAVDLQLSAVISDLGVVRAAEPGGYLVEAKLVETHPSLRAGMYVSVRLPERKREDVPLLPREAVVRQGGREYVYIIDPDQNTAHRREIELGIEEGEYSEARSGIEAGDLVVVRGQNDLRNGDEVEVISYENN